MNRWIYGWFALGFCLATAASGADYASPDQVIRKVRRLASDHRGVKMHVLAQTPGGRQVVLLEIGSDRYDAPAVLVLANPEGNQPSATQAALTLSETLVRDWTDLNHIKWYIVPMVHPDGHARFFQTPSAENFGNERPVNDDMDDQTDEDGPQDLNGDGYITVMRQKHPEGTWLAVQGGPLMKKAERSKGEQGVYRLFPEGIDNDGDGLINEDGPGGVIVGHNFPHRFAYHTSTGGPWPASEEETRGLLRFAFDHPDVVMVLTLGRTNSLKTVPPSSQQAEAGGDKYKLPKQFAEAMGLDPDTEYPIKDLVEMAREYTGYQELTEDMVLQFLGVGAAVNPNPGDLPYWNEVSKRYNEFMKEAKLDGKRLDPPDSPPGSVEEWAYYQYGVSSYSMDFWTLPVKEKESKDKKGDFPSPDEIEKMSNEDFIALGEEKIDAFLKESGAPPQFKAVMVINALKSGMMDTKRMAKMMRDNQKKEDTGGVDEADQALFDADPSAFLEWTPYDHPTLGRVEIGGRRPWSLLAPSAEAADSLIQKQLPFVRELVKLLPRFVIEPVEVSRVRDGVYRVEAWVRNQGFLPYPTHHGVRCKRPVPMVMTLQGDGVLPLEGERRIVLGLLEGSGGSQKCSWLLRAREGTAVQLEVRGPAGTAKTSVTLKGGAR